MISRASVDKVAVEINRMVEELASTISEVGSHAGESLMVREKRCYRTWRLFCIQMIASCACLARVVVMVAWRWRPDGGVCRQVSRCCITL